jgi:hypothetical protein
MANPTLEMRRQVLAMLEPEPEWYFRDNIWGRSRPATERELAWLRELKKLRKHAPYICGTGQLLDALPMIPTTVVFSNRHGAELDELFDLAPFAPNFLIADID